MKNVRTLYSFGGYIPFIKIEFLFVIEDYDKGFYFERRRHKKSVGLTLDYKYTSFSLDKAH